MGFPLVDWAAETAGRKPQLHDAPVLRELVDGFGLCSSNRWKPGLSGKVLELAQNFVLEQLQDVAVVLRGHHLLDGRWFSIRLTVAETPYLFDEKGRVEGRIHDGRKIEKSS